MPRKKLSDDKKKPKISLTINTDLVNILEDHLKDKNVNRSKYIENLVKEDLEKRGYDFSKY